MNSTQVCQVFNRCFEQSESTQLIGGADEPLYVPASAYEDGLARLYFREDFVRSALHEVAHWCIAGAERRQQIDFGYWYEPEGRSATQQRAFERVEVKPQALEACFCRAAGMAFEVSVDNFDDSPASQAHRHAFVQAVQQQMRRYGTQGLPARAHRFVQALTVFIEDG